MTNKEKKYEIELLTNAIVETTEYIGEAVQMGNLAEAKELRFAIAEMRREIKVLAKN